MVVVVPHTRRLANWLVMTAMPGLLPGRLLPLFIGWLASWLVVARWLGLLARPLVALLISCLANLLVAVWRVSWSVSSLPVTVLMGLVG